MTKNEAALQKEIQEGLQWMGYTVQCTQHHPKRGKDCPSCGTFVPFPKGTTSDAGVADLLVTRPEWGGWWRHIEIKRPGHRAEVTGEQRVLRDAGLQPVATSLEECLRILGDQRFNGWRLSADKSLGPPAPWDGPRPPRP